MGFSYSLSNALLRRAFGSVAYTPPTSWWLGLSTTEPTEVGGNFTEPVGSGYARAEIPNGSGDWTTPTVGETKNVNSIAFAPASGSWGTVGWWGVFTASTGGTPENVGALLTPKAPTSTDVVRFLANQLTITLHSADV